MNPEAVLVQAPREKAGAATSRAYEFQKHFALSRLLDAHIAGHNYTAWFDHHDDLVLVETVGGPLSFYQVKSDSKAWSPARLAKRGTTGDNPRSVVGKAYYNIDLFGTGIARATIVSNQMLKATHAAGAKTTLDDGEIVLGALKESEWKLLSEALTADFSKAIDPASKTLLTFERVPLDLYSFADTLKGKVAEFADAIGPSAAAAALPIYTSLLSEITRCTGDTMRAKTLEELKARKAIGRTQVDKLVARVQKRTETPLEWWPVVTPELQTAGMGSLDQQRLRGRCLEYWRARNSGSRAAGDLSVEVRAMIAAHPSIAQGSALGAVQAFQLLGEAVCPSDQPYDDAAAILVELMEDPPDV